MAADTMVMKEFAIDFSDFIIIINEAIIMALSPKTTRIRYKVKKKQNRKIRRV